MIRDRIDTARLALRPFSPADSGPVFDYWRSDPNWERFNASVPASFTEADAERWVTEVIGRDRGVRPSWAVEIDGKVIGVVALTFEQAHRIAVIGYGVHGAFRGRGLSCEAAGAVLDAAFSAVPVLQRIRAHTDARNTESMRVLEKLGFSLEGVLRRNQYVKGELLDEAIFGLLRPPRR